MPQRNVLVGGQRLIMAIGGALRAALKAGNFTSAARESRRRARALAELNASGGIGRPGRARDATDYLQSRGVDVNAMLAPGVGPRAGNPYMDFVEPDMPTRLFQAYADSPFGGSVYDDFPVPGSRGGGRTRLSGVAEGYNVPGPVLRNRIRSGFPIEAPYEGMRRLDNSFDYMGETHARVLPWQGRGSGTNWDLFDEFDGFDGGYSVPSLPMGFTPNALMDSFPYRTFASTSLPSFPNRTISSGRRVNYGDIMNARGSLMQNYNEIPFSQFDIPF